MHYLALVLLDRLLQEGHGESSHPTKTRKRTVMSPLLLGWHEQVLSRDAIWRAPRRLCDHPPPLVLKAI